MRFFFAEFIYLFINLFVNLFIYLFIYLSQESSNIKYVFCVLR
jgi:hypothetical protein